MCRHSRGRVYAQMWTVAICCFGAVQAHATGLIWSDGSSGSEGALVACYDLEVEAELQDAGALLTELRSYQLPASETGQATVTLYRPLSHADSEVVEVLVDAQRIGGRTLPSLEADALRFELVGRLGHPGPLGELGSPLFASDPIPVDSYGGPWRIALTVDEVAIARDTMRALVVPLDWEEHPLSSLRVNVEARTEAPLRAVYSPFHELALTREGAYQVSGSYLGTQVGTSIDLTLLWSSGEAPYHLDILPFRYSAQQGGYFMALLSPPPTATEESVVPRDLVFVIDISGSMSGTKIAQAQEALNAVLEGLRPDDSFSLIAFNHAVTAFSDNTRLADPATVDSAQRFVDGLSADGSTNLYDALSAGFDAMPLAADHPRYIVLLTDGQPTEGETDTEAILDMARRRNEIGARIFTFGIGDDVNTVLLDRLASESSGDPLYIRPFESVSVAVQAFFGRIVNPVLADPVLDFSAFGASEVYPQVLPDLFAGDTVIVVGKYAQPGTFDVPLRGIRGGDQEGAVYRVSLPEYAVQNGHTPRVWATRHVGSLLHEIKLGDDDPRLVDEVMEAAHRFGVITEFTYFGFDENGDMKLFYSEVPVDVTGSVAVETSSSLDSYEESGSVGGGGVTPGAVAAEAWIRHVWDRTLILVDGWCTDTSLDQPEDWVDLEFGSDAYFGFAESESALGAGAFLSLATNLRFELHGRHFRITDPSAELALPEESERVPDPVVPPAESGAVVTGGGQTPWPEVGDVPFQGGQGDVRPGNRGVDPDDPAPAGCCAVVGDRTGPQSPSPAGWVWVFGAIACIATMRRRR